MAQVEPTWLEALYSKKLFENSLRRKESVIPLFQEKDSRLRFLGSGVYITADNRFFLVTADHIADACRRIITAYPNNSFRNLPTKRFYGFKQWADVAVCELEEPLSLYTPLTKENIRDYNELPKDMPLAALGYPETKYKFYASTVDCMLYGILSTEEVSVRAFIANPMRQVRIGVTFERKNVRTADGRPATAPVVNGMSGGGLFWIHSEGRTGPTEPKLIAILTDWDASKQATIVATNIGVVDSMFQKDFGVAVLQRA